jgi:hypothetical protein
MNGFYVLNLKFNHISYFQDKESAKEYMAQKGEPFVIFDHYPSLKEMKDAQMDHLEESLQAIM